MRTTRSSLARSSRAGIYTATSFVLCSALPAVSWAHPGHADLSSHLGSFMTGWLHPLLGWDHLLAMLAIGLFGASQRHSPLARPLSSRGVLFAGVCLGSLGLGALTGFAGTTIPLIEQGLAASVLALGLLLCTAIQLPARSAAICIAGFAALHGYAHAAEMTAGTNALLYGSGFLVSSAVVVAAGAGLAHALRNRSAAPAISDRPTWALRGLGAAIAGSAVVLSLS